MGHSEQTGTNKLREHIFEKRFETAEIAMFTPAQIRSYEDSLKYYRDLKNSLDTAKEEGIEEGIIKGIEKEKINVALKALQKRIFYRRHHGIDRTYRSADRRDKKNRLERTLALKRLKFRCI